MSLNAESLSGESVRVMDEAPSLHSFSCLVDRLSPGPSVSLMFDVKPKT